MSHIDPELLALHALGEGLPAESVQHLDDCAECSAQVESLRAVAVIARDAGDTRLVTPPATVWDGIAAADSGERSAPRTPGVAWLVAAGVGGVLIGAGAVAGWQALDDDAPEHVVASAALEPLTGAASGQAEIVEVDGRLQLMIDLDAGAPESGYHEVWLLTPDGTRLVSLGALLGSTATLDVPDGLDLATFPLIDVSLEPFDGDPAHSGDSLARGELENAGL